MKNYRIFKDNRQPKVGPYTYWAKHRKELLDAVTNQACKMALDGCARIDIDEFIAQEVFGAINTGIFDANAAFRMKGIEPKFEALKFAVKREARAERMKADNLKILKKLPPLPLPKYSK